MNPVMVSIVDLPLIFVPTKEEVGSELPPSPLITEKTCRLTYGMRPTDKNNHDLSQ